ncbi:putative inactive dual specificity protein phosphatase-like [Camellia lanceoleosa]|uniref:Inactive dual specificity protein phosphatase-like n=1 Tax=Camellia lanceoleosa TaxID=1840588 RepID=A0ACC0G6A0_9ERIC|nr:putative inactive dual specificity protein phosphatase-like [Camellia lanceoleosa]
MIGDSYNRREGIDTSKFGADPGFPIEEASADVGISGNSGRVSSRAYRCKKCRRVVALQENIVDHVPGGGETSFGWHKRKGGNPFNKCDEIECSSIFFEPLCWMTTVKEGALEGKLLCVHCEGQASNAVVVAGSPRPFNSIKAESRV